MPSNTTFVSAISIVLLAGLSSCGNSDSATGPTPTPPATAAAPSREDTSWFTRGGDLNRASTLEEWRAASPDQRLASAADLLKMKAKTLPAPAQAMQMARTLEAGITEAANGGEDGALGSVVDRIFDKHQW